MDLLDLPANPIPSGTVLAPVETDDGIAIRAARFPATVRAPRGTVVIFQGRGEQIEKYFHVAEKLRRRGFAVVAFDWRGQGGSGRLIRHPTRHYVRRFLDYERDIEAVRRHVALPDCPPPFFALAHSMGAHIVLRASPRLTPWISRMVLSSPFFDFAQAPLRRSTFRRIAAAVCGIGLGRVPLPSWLSNRVAIRVFEGNPLTSDPSRFEMMMALTRERPHLGIGPPTMRWMLEACRSMDVLDSDRFPGTVPIPALLLNSGADTLVSPVAVERMARRLRSVGYVLVPGARHELMMERDRHAAQFWAAFDAFVPGSAETTKAIEA